MHEPDSSLPSRRDVLAFGVGAFVVSTLSFRGGWRQHLVRRSLPVMGTIAEVAVDDPDARRAHAAIDAAWQQLRRVESMMSKFDTRSDIGRANLHAAHRPVPVARETARVLEAALSWARASGGAFDPCLGRLVDLWDVTHRTEPPAAERVQAFADRRLYTALELDTGSGRPVVRFHDEDVGLDLGGIAKGYGVDQAAEALRALGIQRALINVGGDLAALGDTDPWRIGVRSPEDPRRLARTLEIRSGAVATSGDYERCFGHAGRRYHHLMDPFSAEPRCTDTHSLTVQAGTCLTADAAATACFGLDRDEARRCLASGAADAHVV